MIRHEHEANVEVEGVGAVGHGCQQGLHAGKRLLDSTIHKRWRGADHPWPQHADTGESPSLVLDN